MEDSRSLALEKGGRSSTTFQDGTEEESKSDGEISTTMDGTVKLWNSMGTKTMPSLKSGTSTATTKSSVVLDLPFFPENTDLLSNMLAEPESASTHAKERSFSMVK